MTPPFTCLLTKTNGVRLLRMHLSLLVLQFPEEQVQMETDSFILLKQRLSHHLLVGITENPSQSDRFARPKMFSSTILEIRSDTDAPRLLSREEEFKKQELLLHNSRFDARTGVMAAQLTKPPFICRGTSTTSGVKSQNREHLEFIKSGVRLISASHTWPR